MLTNNRSFHADHESIDFILTFVTFPLREGENERDPPFFPGDVHPNRVDGASHVGFDHHCKVLDHELESAAAN